MHWRVIQHLAESLLKHDTMTGEQVEAAIREGYMLLTFKSALKLDKTDQ
jgi:hypothetical protein